MIPDRAGGERTGGRVVLQSIPAAIKGDLALNGVGGQDLPALVQDQGEVGLQADDVGQTMVRSVSGADPARPLRDEMLALLIESAAAIHGAPNEQQLADVVMDAAIRGTGLW